MHVHRANVRRAYRRNRMRGQTCPGVSITPCIETTMPNSGLKTSLTSAAWGRAILGYWGVQSMARQPAWVCFAWVVRVVQSLRPVELEHLAIVVRGTFRAVRVRLHPCHAASPEARTPPPPPGPFRAHRQVIGMWAHVNTCDSRCVYKVDMSFECLPAGMYASIKACIRVWMHS